MAYDASEPVRTSASVPVAIKILIAGGLGAGKTTLVGSVSEIRPLRTEQILSERSGPADPLAGVEQESATTAALDFGRITIRSDLLVCLFGTPGQQRSCFLCDELAYGALGAVVLADTRRLADCFPSVDYFERRGIPFVVAVNCFDGFRRYPLEAVRKALDLGSGAPVMLCDARRRSSCRDVLVTLAEHAVMRLSGQAAAPADVQGSYGL
jgi:signal recognition particle receptor subunit beta